MFELAQQSVNNAARLTIRPAAGKVWRVINIYFAHGGSVDTIKLHRVSAAGDIVFRTNAADVYAFESAFWIVTNDIYLEVENATGSARLIGYDVVEVEDNS